MIQILLAQSFFALAVYPREGVISRVLFLPELVGKFPPSFGSMAMICQGGRRGRKPACAGVTAATIESCMEDWFTLKDSRDLQVPSAVSVCNSVYIYIYDYYIFITLYIYIYTCMYL